MKTLFLISFIWLGIPASSKIVNKITTSQIDTIMDYAINDIGLNEYDNIKKKLGNAVILQLKKSSEENKEVWIQTQVLNYSSNKYFRLVLQEGSSCCQYFEIGYNDVSVKGRKFKSKYKDFVSDNGIKLGIDSSTFLKCLPNLRFSITKVDKITTYNYFEKKPKGDSGKYYNDYVSEYVFYKNKLIKFGFGTIYTIPHYALKN